MSCVIIHESCIIRRQNHSSNGALRPLVMSSTPQCPGLGFPAQTLFASENHVAPPALAITFFAHASVEDFHPAFLVCGCIGVEVDDLSVVEADSEALFDEHVAFLFFCEAGLAALASLAAGFLLGESPAVVDQLAGVGEVDGCAGLAG